MKPGIIYKAISPSGKIYIGQTTQTLKERIRDHYKVAFNSNSRIYNSKLSQSIRKYGKNNIKWEILENNIDNEKLDELEIYFIQKFDSFKNGYNSTLGGRGKGRVVSDETKFKLSLINKGKIVSKETGQKISAANKGRKASEETKLKISMANRDKKKPPLTEEHKMKLSSSLKGKTAGSKNYFYGKSELNPFYGKKHSEKSKLKMSQSHKGKIISEETKLNMSKAQSGENNPNSKLTREIVETIRKQYASGDFTQKELAEIYEVKRLTINRIIREVLWKKK